MQDHISLYLMYHHHLSTKTNVFSLYRKWVETASVSKEGILRLFWGFHQMDIGMNVCVSPTVHFFRFFSNPFSPLRLNLLCLLAAQSSYFSLFFIEAWAIFGGREASVASSVSVLPSKSKARDFLARQACTHVKVPVARSSTKKNKASLL